MILADEEYPTLAPMGEAGSGEVREKQTAYLSEIIAKLNDLFGSDTTDGDQLSFVKAITTKMAESELLRSQANANTKEQFSASPDLTKELQNANIESFDAFENLSKKVLNSEELQKIS